MGKMDGVDPKDKHLVDFNVVVCGSSCTAHDVSKFYPRFLLVKQPYFCWGGWVAQTPVDEITDRITNNWSAGYLWFQVSRCYPWNKVFKAMLFHMDLSTIFNQLIHHRYPLRIHRFFIPKSVDFQPQNGMISMVFHVVKHHGSEFVASTDFLAFLAYHNMI